jgi:hypothetical protein
VLGLRLFCDAVVLGGPNDQPYLEPESECFDRTSVPKEIVDL